MKRYLFVTAILLATGLHATAQTPEQLWESANTAYINENYQEAVKDYESIRAQGYQTRDDRQSHRQLQPRTETLSFG